MEDYTTTSKYKGSVAMFPSEIPSYFSCILIRRRPIFFL